MLSLHKNSLLYALIKEVAEEVLCDNKMRLLELFSGTHSVGKVAKKMGYEVVSVDRDINAKCPFGSDYVSDKHIKTDIMTWDYKKDYKPGDFVNVKILDCTSATLIGEAMGYSENN